MPDIQSPLPGTFYHRPSPESDPFKKEGDDVGPEDTIGLVEVMKTFIEVKAEVSGKFEGYVAPDAEAVQAGDVLAKVG